MHPILFEIGPIVLYSYGAMVASGFLIAMFLASREGRRAGSSPGAILDVGLCALLFGILGARALHVLLNFGYYTSRPIEIVLINHGGLAIHGGLIGGIAAAWIFMRRNKMHLWKTADIIIPYVALGQSIGRIGCLLNGCCYGIATTLPFGIVLPGHLQRLHPTQAYSSIFLFFVFIALRRIYKRKRFDGEVFFSYLAIFSSGRFFLDFLRGDLHVVFLGLKTSQFISAVIFLASLAWLMIKHRGGKRP